MDDPRSQAIIFWETRFKEHYEILEWFLLKNQDAIIDSGIMNVEEFDEVLNNMMDDEPLWKYPDTYYDIVLDIFTESNVPDAKCIVPLIHHMKEEVEYFEDAILDHKMSYDDQLRWWAREHAENLEFVKCQLPRLFKFDIKMFAAIPLIFKVMFGTDGLIKQFKALSEATWSPGAIEEEDLVRLKMRQAKIQHIEAIDDLLQNLNKLPITKENAQLLKFMLGHERKEAMFAFKQLDLFNL